MKKFEGNSNAYGKIIEKYRKNKNMSRADVSRELDLIDIPINPDELYRIEKQIMVLKDYELIAICMILGIDYNDLIKIINAIAPYKKKITVNTNGYNLKCLLPVITKLDKVIVSVMGNEKINNDIVGVTPELDKIKEFHKLNPKLKLRVNCVVNKKGIDSFDKMEEFALEMKKLGFTSIKFSEMSTDDPNDPNFIDLQELLKPYCDDVHQNDTLQNGCYLEPKSLEKRFGIKTILNLTCNLKTPIKQSQFQSLNYEPMCFDSIYISPDGSIHKRIVASQDLANDRGAC